MSSRIKKASTLPEIFRSLTPSTFLTQEEREFYIKIYDERVALMRIDLLENNLNPVQTIYVSGQTGSGKTTALNFLANDAINKVYQVEYLYGNDIFDLDDLDIVDVLLMVAFKLVGDDQELKRKFEERLERLRKQLEGELKEEYETQKGHQTNAGAKGDVSFGENPILKFLSIFQIKGGFFADYKFNYDNRQIVREVLTPRRDDLLKLLNELIELYRIKNNEKQVLLIFHELNHMQNPDAIEKLFVTDRYYLEGIRAKKVVTIPVALVPITEFNQEVYVLGLKLKPNPLRASGQPEQTKKEKDAIERNSNFLRDVFKSRMTEQALALVSEEAVEYAIHHSGGNIRQFISILYYALRRVMALEGSQVSLNDAEEGAIIERRKLERSMISDEKIQLLEYVRVNKTPRAAKDETFLSCALANQLFLYENDKIWYDVNPLIEETVKVYAERLGSKSD